VTLYTIRDGTTAAYGAISDRAGHFSIANVEPGTYFFRPERRGFVYAPSKPASGMPTVTLKPGQRLTDFRIDMTARAVIVGRVLDEHGDPMQNVTVAGEAIPKTDEWMPGMHTGTDDRGEFRLSGPPGKYVVNAMPQTGDYGSPGGVRIPEVRTDGSSEAIYNATYYPSAVSANRAAAIEAAAGRTVTGIEIRLVRQRRLAISGVVSGIPPGSSGTRIELQTEDGFYRDGGNYIAGARTANPAADGSFSFPSLEPGSYRLLAMHSSGNTALHSSLVDVKLDIADLTNLQLVLGRAGDLTGTLEIAGAPPGGLPVEGRRIWLEGWGSSEFTAARGASGEVSKDSSFRIGNVLPGHFRMRVDPMPENTYFQSAQVDGVPAVDGEVILPQGGRGSVVKVTLGADGAQVTGAILDKGGEKMVNPIAFVFLLPAPDYIWTPDRMARAGPDGKYNFKGIRPGKYRIFATEPTRGGGLEVMKAMAAKAEEIEIEANGRITKDLKLIGMEAASAP
jgi:hypothetical protein